MSQNNADEEDLSEQLSKLFACPDENQCVIPRHPQQTNVRPRWISTASNNNLPTSKYLQQFDKSNYSDTRSLRSVSQDRGGRNISSDRATSRVSGDWRSPKKGHEAISALNRNRSEHQPKPTERNARPLMRNDKIVNKHKTDKELEILLQLSYLEPETISLSLSEDKIAFLDVLDNDVSLNHLVLLLRIANKLWSSTLDEQKIKMITQLLDKKILDSLKSHLSKLPIYDSTDKEASVHFWKEPETFWNNLYNFYEAIFTLMPNTACELLPKMIKISLITMEDVMQYQGIEIPRSVMEKFESFQQGLTEFVEEEATKKQTEVLEPPDDFQWINPYPSIKEITTRDLPFIRPIITEGAYESVHHYLDVQYRLLREDFVASLRNGICTYLNRPNTFKFEKQYDVRIYERVQCIQPQIVHNGIAQLVQFSSKMNRALRPEDSKHLIYGSLVCFSRDHFNTVIFGTVVDNDKRFLRKGQVVVNVKGTLLNNCNYTMVECNVFFEPYYHVLQSLKKIDENHFPFQKYIVDVSSDTVHPKYIRNLTRVRYNDRIFRILSAETWPKAEEMRLNTSQYKAFQSALTREFCIIQGPPGTGKTYTSLKIAEFLLKNKSNLGYSGPILVVCFTNHALDQFLEGLLPFTERLLRVGGRSKNEQMKEYNLKHYKKVLRTLCLYERNRLLNRRRQKWSQIDFDEVHEYANKYAYLNISHYDNRLKSVGNSYKEIHENLKPINETMDLIKDIYRNIGIIDFNNFKRIDYNLRNSWFSGATNSDILEWLMDKETIANVQELQEENENTEDYNMYLNADRMNRDRLVIDDDDESPFSIFDSCSDQRYLISLNDYAEIKENLEEHKNKISEKLNPENYDRELLYLNREIRSVECQEKYLKWRLRQFNIGETVVKPENIDYNNPKLLSSDERWTLYRYWTKKLHQRLCDKVSDLVDDGPYKAFQAAVDDSNIHIMERMDVIGMTTTGAAKNYDVLQELNCPIVIVEEAAEVLEAHVVTALSARCQHLILIGDHKQLRPNTSQYNLAKKYNLDISLFERMVHNGIHCQQLEVQHRMSSAISRLIVPAIYSTLYNGDNVYAYPPIRGVTKSLYFITHTQYEDATYDSSSHKNVYEAVYLLELARYLLRQGYSSEDVTILTTYSGQMFCLWQERKDRYPDLDAVTITVVDNFQGEESKIILLSLVRSNSEANIGFLKTENRVCVALSRAKEGMYIIGNMNNLEASSTIWPKIKEALVDQDAIGCSLTLKCQIHETVTEIKTHGDFKKVPEGGCNLLCETDLQCGHKCTLHCHSYDTEHEQYFCREKCEKVICARNHVCPLPCGADCSPCLVLVEMELLCSHKRMVPCSTNLAEYKCLTVVNVQLPCEHSMNIACHEQSEKVKCTNVCGQLLNCTHNCTKRCHIGDDDDHLKYSCKEPCQRFKKDCSIQEHKCDLLCHESCSPCEEMVKKRRTTCTHSVTVQCNASADDTVCREKCRKVLPCGHYCPMKCFEPCGNCPVQVTKTIPVCGHTLKVKCNEQPDRHLCKEQCPLQLKCGHVCKNKCNEPCTEICAETIISTDSITGEEVTRACNLKSNE